jgi:hypothetical protein
MTGRAGTIVFDLQADADTARGEVWMSLGDRYGGAYAPEGRVPPYFHTNERVQVLTIRFVRVEGGLLSGVLDPYHDPLTGVQLMTIFRGWLEGDVIVGEFAATNPVTGEFSTGRWKVERKAVNAHEEKR